MNGAKRPVPKGLTPFKKGQSGNPKGGKRIPDDLRQIRTVDGREFKKRASKYLLMTVSELDSFEKDPTTQAIDLIIISIIKKAGKAGDWMRFNFLLDRLIGKVGDKDLGSENSGQPKLIILPSNGRELIPNPSEQKSEDEQDVFNPSE